MGHKDLVKLHQIYKECNWLNEEYNFGFKFKVDDGDYETRIDISRLGVCYVGNGKLPLIGFDMYCPDLLDFNNKIIIEYEEEAKPNKGARRRKGHLEVNNHDVKRDWAYLQANFDVCKIWESDKNWRETLKQFLIKTYAKRKIVESE